MKNLILRICNKLNFEILLNIIVFIVICFFNNFLEEDLLLGAFSSITIFFIYFCLKLFKSSELREYRLNMKKIYRVQRSLLSRYYFLARLFPRRFFRYSKKFLKKSFNIILEKLYINTNLKTKNIAFQFIFTKSINILLIFLVMIKYYIKRFSFII